MQAKLSDLLRLCRHFSAAILYNRCNHTKTKVLTFVTAEMSKLTFILLLTLLIFVVVADSFKLSSHQNIRILKFSTKSLATTTKMMRSNSKFVESTDLEKQLRRNKMMKRWVTGLSLGAIGTLWIFSGNGLFTLGFLVASLIAQNEYYSMVKAAGKRAGIKPASKTGTVSSLLCYVTGMNRLISFALF